MITFFCMTQYFYFFKHILKVKNLVFSLKTDLKIFDTNFLNLFMNVKKVVATNPLPSI